MAMVHKLLNKNSRVIKETLIYTITSTVRNAISFILLLFVSYYMPPEELGIATNFLVLSSIVSLLAGEAVVNSLPYFYYEQTKDKNAIFIFQIFLYSIVICILMLFFILLFNSFLEDRLKLSLFLQLLTIPYVIGSLLFNMNSILYRLEERPFMFAGTQIAYTLFSCFNVCLLVIFLRLGGKGKIYSDVVSLFVFALFSIYIINKRGYLRCTFSKFVMKKLLKFSVPLLPHSMASWLGDGINKILITSFCGLYYNGLYSMALTLTIIYKTLGNSFFYSYTPRLQKKLSIIDIDNNVKEKMHIVKVVRYMWVVFFVVAFLSLLAGWFVLTFILDSKYEGSFMFLPYMLLSIFIYYVYVFAMQLIYKMKKTFIMGLITFTGSVLQMSFSYFLIRDFGAIGAVYSSVVSSVFVCIGIFLYSNKVYPMPWLSLKKR